MMIKKAASFSNELNCLRMNEMNAKNELGQRCDGNRYRPTFHSILSPSQSAQWTIARTKACRNLCKCSITFQLFAFIFRLSIRFHTTIIVNYLKMNEIIIIIIKCDFMILVKLKLEYKEK